MWCFAPESVAGRYGKNFVLDIMDVDLGPQLAEFFDAIEPVCDDTTIE